MTDKGYKVRIKGSKSVIKLDFFCPACGRISGSLDDKCMQEYGFCRTCFVMHVEDRQVPTIDLEKYKPVK